MSKVNESKAAPEGAQVAITDALQKRTLAEMTPEERIVWGDRVLNDPVFLEVLETLKRSAYEAWLNPEQSTPEKRERLWAFARGLDKLHAELRTLVNEGRVDKVRMRQIGDGK